MIQKRLCYDVAVLGGGTSGVAAALSAARNGAKTLLVERNQFLGGTMASGLSLLGFQDRQGRAVVGGIAQELVDALQETDDTLGHNHCPILNSLTPINAAMMQLRLVQKCREAGVSLLFSCEACRARVEQGRLKAVTVVGKGHSYDIEASVFIDATGDGDVGAMAGVPYIKGSETGEIQPASLIFSLSGVKRAPLLDYLDQHPEEAKTPDTYEMETSIDLYRSARGYNFLGLDGIIRTARENGEYNDIPRDRFSTITHPLPDRMTINNTRVIRFDGSDLLQLTQGTVEGYRQMAELLRFIPRYVPGYEQSTLTHIAPMLGVRESRRFIGEKTLCRDSALQGEIPPDTVALCGYNIDIHHGNDEGSDLYIVEHPYGIPYGVMVSEPVDGLLFTGRLISVDWDTYGSSRIMSTCMALGEAAGAAASMCAQTGTRPARLDVQALRDRLRAQGAILEVEA